MKTSWLALAILLLLAPVHAEERNHCVAATPEELARLKKAYKGSGAEHAVVASIVQKAEARIGQKIEFPPRGGRMSHWLKCPACQVDLKSLDDTHHECPKCKKVYSGEPYDDTVFWTKHERLLLDAVNAAWAYAATGDRKFAAFAGEVLKGYAQRYSTYAYRVHDGKNDGPMGGHLTDQSLTEAEWFARNIAPAYDLVFETLSADERSSIEDKLIRPLLATVAKSPLGKSNWQSWHNAAMLAGGAVLGDPTWIQRALKDPKQGLSFQLESSIGPEGFWYEGSVAYHYYALAALVVTAETARRQGIDAWSDPRLKKACLIPLDYVMPDGTLPMFGDTDHEPIASIARDTLEPACAALRDPRLLAALPVKPNLRTVLLGLAPGPAVEAAAPGGSAVFRGAGHAILRTAGPAGLTAATTFGEHGGWHGHYDKLSFVLYGFGHELGVDPGRARPMDYSAPEHEGWYKATWSHNSVVVDRASQRQARGKVELYAATKDHAAIALSSNEAYPGVTYGRVLVLSPSYLLVLDELSSDADHRFDWIYHGRAARVGGLLATATAPDEYTYIHHVRAGTTRELVRIDFMGDEVSTRITLAREEGTQVALGEGRAQSEDDKVPVAIVTRKGLAARFAAVLEPRKTGDPPDVTDVRLKVEGDLRTVVVTRSQGEDVIELKRKDAITVRSDGKKVLSTP